MVKAFVGLGSNLGEREVTLRAAIGRLRGLPDVEVTHAPESSFARRA